MSSTPYMKLYINDYIGDTQHLTTEQHGAYLLMLMAMWRSGGRLPNDPAKLCRIARVSPKRWKAMSADVMEFFDIEGDDITQKRLAREHQNATSIREERRNAGSAGGKAKAFKKKEAQVANAMNLPEQGIVHSHNHSKPPLPPVVDEHVAPAVEKTEAVAPDEIARKELIDLKKGIVAAFREAGSMTLAPDTHRAERWVAQGYRPAMVLAVVREILARHPNVKSLSYFDNPIREAHENAASKTSVASPVDEGKRLNFLRSMVQEWQREPTTWPTRLGPRPDDAGCTVPANILAEFGIQPRERRAA